MKPREIRQNDAQDLFRSRLDQIIDMNHQLVKLGARVNWDRLEAVCGEAYRDGPGMQIRFSSAELPRGRTKPLLSA